jgi:quinol monooxygenase YgiN
VSDYGQWKRAYDEFAPVRKANGVTGASVHRDASDPNTVIVTHRFRNLDAAKAFADSEELKSAMAKAGVSSPPEIWFCEDVEATPY